MRKAIYILFFLQIGAISSYLIVYFATNYFSFANGNPSPLLEISLYAFSLVPILSALQMIYFDRRGWPMIFLAHFFWLFFAIPPLSLLLMPVTLLLCLLSTIHIFNQLFPHRAFLLPAVAPPPGAKDNPLHFSQKLSRIFAAIANLLLFFIFGFAQLPYGKANLPILFLFSLPTLIFMLLPYFRPLNAATRLFSDYERMAVYAAANTYLFLYFILQHIP